MKILMVNKFLYPRGGSESYMLYLAEYLKKLGHEVEFFGMYDEKNTLSFSSGFDSAIIIVSATNVESPIVFFSSTNNALFISKK